NGVLSRFLFHPCRHSKERCGAGWLRHENGRCKVALPLSNESLIRQENTLNCHSIYSLIRPLTRVQLIHPIGYRSRRHIIWSPWRYVEIQIPSGAPSHQGYHFLRLSHSLAAIPICVLQGL